MSQLVRDALWFTLDMGLCSGLCLYTMEPQLSFETAPHLQPLTQAPLLILVGLTGVGKSSIMEGLAFPTLPNRREVVDQFVLPKFGFAPDAKLDRAKRFEITRAFREQYPGGVAEALTHAYVDHTQPLLFDGLRGQDEVRYALEALPLARFIVLGASDMVRLGRLLGRTDSFDRIEVSEQELAELDTLAQGILTPEQLQQALSWGNVADVAAKLKIVAEERKNYDPDGAAKVLQGNPRALIVDTDHLSIEQIVASIKAWLA